MHPHWMIYSHLSYGSQMGSSCLRFYLVLYRLKQCFENRRLVWGVEAMAVNKKKENIAIEDEQAMQTLNVEMRNYIQIFHK